ncbi:hypothetical protein TWF106_008976 [Orbilia oligospora]|uniref:Uncharacterized protein n=1 Tax=Orbilia oligospora TaxID=2813651 RepID=A0A7C8QM86_ORBOL|nr:hypothetical protein TWF191_010159 [Orbilia oligospora]KAF3214617.1 hypothetical protein TWF106_008976 [Orbilia oligospora]
MPTFVLKTIVSKNMRLQLAHWPRIYRRESYTEMCHSLVSYHLFKVRLLATAAFLHQYVDGPVEYPVKAEAKDMSFVLFHQAHSLIPNSSAEGKRVVVLGLQFSRTVASSQMFISLAFVPLSLVRDIEPMNIHGDTDYDIQLIFSDMPYLEEACDPVFEASAVVVLRRDVGEWLRMARAQGKFEDMTLEIVRGPTRVFDETGECWVISLVLL